MQLTAYSISTTGSNCLSWGEPINASVTLKTGSSEKLSASNMTFLYVDLVFNNTYTMEGKELVSTDGNIKALHDEDFSIGKNTSKTFTSTDSTYYSVPEEDAERYWNSEMRSYGDKFRELTGDNGAQRAYPCALYVSAFEQYGTGTPFEIVKDSVVTFLLYRLDPKINGYAMSDEHERNPLGHFGAFIQDRSLPRLKFDITLDPLDPSLTSQQKLVLTLPDKSTLDYSSYDGIFDLPALSQTGSYNWVYTVTDSVGNSASESGSFEVLAYSPPRFDALAVQRYAESVDDEGNPVYTATADGDRIRFTIDADVAPVARLNAWTLKRLRDDTGETVTLLSGSDGAHITRIEDRSLDASVYSPSSTIGVTLILSDFFEMLERYEVILKAGGYLHVTKAGTAVGMRSTATPQKKKFEVAEDCEAHLYGGVWGGGHRIDRASRREELEVLSPFAPYSNSDEDITPTVTRVGPLVFLDGLLTNTKAVTINATAINAIQLPEWARPKLDVFVLHQGSSTNFFWLRVNAGSGIVIIARYRNGTSYASVAAGAQFPITASWIAADAAKNG